MNDREKIKECLLVSACITGAKISETEKFIEVKGIRRFHFNNNGSLVKVEPLQIFHKRNFR